MKTAINLWMADYKRHVAALDRAKTAEAGALLWARIEAAKTKRRTAKAARKTGKKEPDLEKLRMARNAYVAAVLARNDWHACTPASAKKGTTETDLRRACREAAREWLKVCQEQGSPDTEQAKRAVEVW